MNIILIEKKDFIKNDATALIDDRRFSHISKILKPSLGTQFKCGEIGGKMGSGIVSKITDSSIEIDVDLNEEPPKKAEIDLVVALPRPQFLKRIIQSAVSMGVPNIFFIHSERVEKSYWQTPLLNKDSLREQMLLGLEQAGDTILPSVTLCRFFKPFVEDTVPGIIKDRTAILAHPYSNNQCSQNTSGPVILAIGPEGGFLPYEVDKLTKAGFLPVTMGHRILKTETAVVALIAKFM